MTAAGQPPSVAVDVTGVAKDLAPAIQSTTLEGANRQLTLPPCRVTTDDLRKLAAKMEQFAREAAEREVRDFKLLEGQTTEQLEQLKSRTREALQLEVQVRGDAGEWRSGRASDVLREDALPDVVTQVTFDTSFGFRAVAQRAPINGIVINLDFRRRALLDLSNAASAAEENVSSLMVHGAETAWVDGVYEQLRKFFAERRTLWRWLHAVPTYDVLLMTVGFTLIFFWVDRADGWIARTFSPALRVGALIYVAVLLLYIFRLIFNLACRVFPRTMGPRSGTGGGFAEAVFLVMTIVGWLSTLFLDQVAKWIMPSHP